LGLSRAADNDIGKAVATLPAGSDCWITGQRIEASGQCSCREGGLAMSASGREQTLRLHGSIRPKADICTSTGARWLWPAKRITGTGYTLAC